MGKIPYVLDLIQYHGLKGFAQKAREKIIVNRGRFKIKSDCNKVPHFQQYQIKSVVPCETHSESSKSIFYWIHCFYPKSQGGTERFLLNLAKQQQGNVRIFTLGTEKMEYYPSRISGIAYREYFYCGLPIVEFRYMKTPNGLFYKRLNTNDAEMKQFMECWIRKEKPDLVHCVYPQTFASGLELCKAQRIPYIITLTDFNILCHYATMVDKQGSLCPGCNQGFRCGMICKTSTIQAPEDRYRVSSALLRNASYVTVPSNFVAYVIHQEYEGIDPIVIPHGISDEFRPCGPKTRDAVKRFAYFGTLTPMKGVHLLLQAFSLCRNEQLELHIYGAGEPHYTEQIKRLAHGDRRVVLHGKVPPHEMSKFYQENDCIVVPSMWYETYNFVVREALACGKIVLAADIGAMPEVIREHQNGLLFEAGSVSSLQQAIEDAVSTRWPVQKNRFPTPESEARSYERLYEEMSCAEA